MKSAVFTVLARLLVVVTVVTGNAIAADAETPLTAEAVVERVNAVPEGESVGRTLEITMTSASGKQRKQSAVSYRKQFPEGRKTALFFQRPANIRGTGFLIWDYSEPQEEDDQWLYLPALRKARRVSSADRGGYFLGTDFTYEDMKLDGKLEPLDYNFTLLQSGDAVEGNLIQLEAVAKTRDKAEELGYSRTLSWIDTSNWILTRAEFYDPAGNLLKTLEAKDIRQVDGIWTRHILRMHNHQTGHSTLFQFLNVDYLSEVSDNLFSKQTLNRGP